MFRPPTPIVKNLLIINIGIYLAVSLLSLNLNEQFGLYFILSDQFRAYQFVTYMFLHGDLRHVFGNMLILFFVGPMLEGFLGPKKFLTLYMVTGLGGGLLFTAANYLEIGGLKRDMEAYVVNPSPEEFNRFIDKHGGGLPSSVYHFINEYAENPGSGNEAQSVSYARQIYVLSSETSVVGASGAMFGILAMLMILFPNTEMLLFFTFPIKVKYLVGGLILYEAFSELERAPGDHISHLAHLGGALFAWLLYKYWQKNRTRFY